LHISENATDFLTSLHASTIHLGLERVALLLETLGSPQDKVPCIHIAGTNGKGSCSAMLHSVLTAAGYTVGCYTSPHLVSVRERMAVNHTPIEEAVFSQMVMELKQHLETLFWKREEWPTYFEFLTVLGFLYFYREQVDIAIIETGLGGRLDATNVIQKPIATVITSIDYDHQEWLGDTLTQIATEKAGILKETVPLVLGPSLPEEAKKAIVKIAVQKHVPITEVPENRLLNKGVSTATGRKILDTQIQRLYTLSLLPPYQVQNCATVLTTLEVLQSRGWSIPETAVKKGLTNTEWQGRFQWCANERLIIDGSHNPQGFRSLEVSLLDCFPMVPLVWLVSLQSNREPQCLLDLIGSEQLNTKAIIFTTNPGMRDRYHDPQALLHQFQALKQHAVFAEALPFQEAVIRFKDLIPEYSDGIGVLTGSLYTVGEFLSAQNGRK
jgi:dihydrofolate synthase / folylpolyglutamate synthase